MLSRSWAVWVAGGDGGRQARGRTGAGRGGPRQGQDLGQEYRRISEAGPAPASTQAAGLVSRCNSVFSPIPSHPVGGAGQCSLLLVKSGPSMQDCSAHSQT